jgi:hypothetical protein
MSIWVYWILAGAVGLVARLVSHEARKRGKVALEKYIARPLAALAFVLICLGVAVDAGWWPIWGH